MIGCAVTSDLARYEREIDEAAARDEFVEQHVEQHKSALARRLIRHREWLIQTLDENRDLSISVAAAVGYAAEGDYLLAGSRLVRALEPQAKEDAGRILTDELNAYIDALPPKRFRDPDGAGPPEAEDIDLSKHYPDYSA